jgi:hypothetical protein
MAEFYVEINPQSNGEHIVHKSDCSILPSKDAIHYLGAIASCGSAVKKASGVYRQVNGCSQCSVACHTA